MKMLKISRIISVFLALVLLLSLTATAVFENTYENTGNQAVDLIEVALSQIGYEENTKNESKYAEWYGLPGASWCAMFVSWCLNEAGVTEEQVKPFASCTQSMTDLKKAELWQDGPAYGGDYSPVPGDLVYFNWYGTSIANHVGIVLYTENGWLYSIEGNANSNRLDDMPKPPSADGVDSSITGAKDEVMIRCYKLDSELIRGYGTPAYEGSSEREEELPPIVDVPRDSARMDETQRVLDAGFMTMMSSHTFGCKYGVTRGEYVVALAKFFGISEYDESTEKFADVEENHPAYGAIMAFRASGLVGGVADNRFCPDTYITARAARVILERMCRYLKVDPIDVGYKGKPVEGYLQRFELAHALCLLMDHHVAHVSKEAVVLLDGWKSTVSAESINGSHYVTGAGWETLLAGTAVNVPAEKLAVETLGVPDGWLHRIAVERDNGEIYEVTAVSIDGVRWYKLRDIAAITDIGVEWSREQQAIVLSLPAEETLGSEINM